MSLKDWLLPIVSVALGLLSLFTDNKKSKRVTYLLLAMLASGLITVLVNAADARKNRVEQTKADQRIDQLIHGNNLLIEGNRHIASTAEEILNGLSSSGLIVKSVVDVVATSLRAGKARKDVLSEVRDEPTQRPLVLYFPKDVDAPTVIQALQEAHFTVDTRNAKLTDITTNKIWIGDSVSVADAKLVALTLVQAGAKIKAIRHFLAGAGPKANLIEVGASAKLANAPALTVEQITALSSIPRDTN